MSQGLLENPLVVAKREPSSAPDAVPNPTKHRPPMLPWKWAAITCLILLISGGIRFGRDMQFRGIAQQSAKCPFPLSDLPTALGTWTAVPNSDTHLDPAIARLAGSSDHVIRSYVSSTTHEVATVLVLYGLADSVFAHTPEICYHAAGFQFVGPAVDREVLLPDSPTPVRFRGMYVSKPGVGMMDYSEVVWSFWHAGSWWPNMGTRWKYFRSAPGMFKVQIQRVATGISTEEFSCESLLKDIVQDINARIEQAKAVAPNGPMRAETSG
jgi:Protein of unknown function (DUF3485)